MGRTALHEVDGVDVDRVDLVSGLGFRESDSGIRVSDLRFRDSGLGLRVETSAPSLASMAARGRPTISDRLITAMVLFFSLSPTCVPPCASWRGMYASCFMVHGLGFGVADL